MSFYKLVIPEPRFAQRFLLHRVARWSAALIVAGTLEFDRVTGSAVGVHQQKIDAFGVDAGVRFGIGGDEFPYRHLG